MAERPARPAPPDPGARARMPLIEMIAAGALDDEYAERAERRVPAETGPDLPLDADAGERAAPLRRRPRPGALAAVAVAVFAVLVTISFQQTRDNESANDASRATLEERIRARRTVVAAAQDRIVALRSDNAAAEANVDLLAQTDAEAEAAVAVLRQQAGFTDVTGEGLRIVVGDNPDGEARVYDEDLALLVNGLWRAGATAISVNGFRITVLTSFRFSGVAIRLNDHNVSLAPPYTVLALGDTGSLAADLLDTTSGLRFQGRVDQFGLDLEMQNEQQLTLPAAPQRLADRLRWARAATPTADQDAPTRKETTR